jgi:hypothetical protein
MPHGGKHLQEQIMTRSHSGGFNVGTVGYEVYADKYTLDGYTGGDPNTPCDDYLGLTTQKPGSPVLQERGIGGRPWAHITGCHVCDPFTGG